jgi:hypothetical protein
MTEARAWVLTFNAPAPMYSENSRHHWRKTGPAVKAWREASFLFATQAKLPKGLARVRIDVALHFTDARRRDRYNLHRYVVKPIVDGLSRPRTVNGKRGVRVEPGYELIPDDSPEFLDGPFITIGAKVDKRQHPLGLALITITDLGGGRDDAS